MKKPGALAWLLAVAVPLALPATALAHGLTGRADLPIPLVWFGWGAAGVLVISFVALAFLWAEPVLDREPTTTLPDPIGRAITSRPVEIVCGVVGVGLFALVVATGLAGTDVVSENLAPTFVYVVFWLGLVPVSVLFGDVFRAFNPWRAIGRFTGWALGSRVPEPLPYPVRLGRWPAAAGLAAFGYLELVSSTGDRPSTIATAILLYSAITWTAMAVYGVEPWASRADAFSVYFNLFSRLSIFERRGRSIMVRRPLSGLARFDSYPGTVGVVAVMIGTVSFDGLSGGPSFQERLKPVVTWLREDLGLGPRPALELAFAVCLVLSILFIYAFYRVGIAGARATDRRHSARELASAFAPSLVPIALAYAAAHYVSLLIFRGQAIAQLVSDPFGDGSNLFGTGTWGIDYGIVGAETFWYLQLGFVLAGHVAGLMVAHDRALTLYDDPRAATRSQYWMLAVMVGFTSLALWLLSEASKG